MLESLTLKNFKGFADTHIAQFAKVNIVLGGQNVGKTSLLEAIYLLTASQSRPNNQSRYYLASIFRHTEGRDHERFWDYLIDEKKDTIVSGEISGETFQITSYNDVSELEDSEIVVRASFPSNKVLFTSSDNLVEAFPEKSYHPDAFSVLPVSNALRVQQYGLMVTSRQKKRVIELLKKIEPRIEGIDAVAPDGEHKVYVEFNDDRVLPVDHLGQGFGRLLHIYTELAVSQSKLALIDEVENGIHYQSLPQVMKGIRALSEQRELQTVMTTHSWECIRAACEAFEDKPQDLQAIRLERDGDNIKAVCIPGEQLMHLVEDNMEVR